MRLTRSVLRAGSTSGTTKPPEGTLADGSRSTRPGGMIGRRATARGSRRAPRRRSGGIPPVSWGALVTYDPLASPGTSSSLVPASARATRNKVARCSSSLRLRWRDRHRLLNQPSAQPVTGRFDTGYYVQLEARTSALVRTFDQTFPAEQIVLLLELTEHNEPRVAVEMLSSMLAESGSPVAREVRDEFRALAEMMRLEPRVWNQLRTSDSTG